MRKSLVAQGVAVLIGGLALAGAANAAVVVPGVATVNGVVVADNLAVNNDGTGHINIIPYYSVQNNNDTYLNIINADTRNGKAVKVRFRGASNSDDVFDITVLMSPGDSWAAAITRGADGLPVLKTSDKTCTLPGGIGQNAGTPFVTLRLDTTLDAAGKANQAREGYVEILNMADIPPVLGTAAGTSSTTANPLYTAIKHVNGVAPCTAATLDTLFTFPEGSTYADALAKGFDAPTTGLMTSWVVINVPKASSFSGNAVALQARQGSTESSPAGYGNIVFFPQSSAPVSTPANYTTDPLFTTITAPATTSAITALSYDFPDLSTPYFARGGAAITPREQAQELSTTLAVSSVSNEFVTDPVVLGKTDWVFSMPTRRYSVAFDYVAGTRVYTDISQNAGDRDFFTADNTSVTNRQICVGNIATTNSASVAGLDGPNRVNGVTADREERFLTSSTDFVVSPGLPAAPLTFCGEVSVLSFNAGTTGSVVGAAVARKDLTMAYTNGWLRLQTPGLPVAGATGTGGLPIVGAAMIELFNSAVSDGFSGGFGITLPHRVTRANVVVAPVGP